MWLSVNALLRLFLVIRSMQLSWEPVRTANLRLMTHHPNLRQPFLNLVVGLDDTCRQQRLGEGWYPTFDDVPSKATSISTRRIMNSSAIACTVAEEGKAVAVRHVVESEVSPNVPASILQLHANTTLFLDVPAASLLS